MDDEVKLASPQTSTSQSDEQRAPLTESSDLQSNSKVIQAKPSKKMKPNKKKKKKKDDGIEETTVLVDAEEDCMQHSFCVVESLKHKGVKPFQPKGLPWSSGLLPYLPGQRPDHFEKSKQELAAIAVKKKKIEKRKQKDKKRIMKRLREGDHKKLCYVMNTSQELMILMRIISMVMEKKKSDMRRRINGVQTDTIPEEDEGEIEETEEDEEDDEDEEGDEEDAEEGGNQEGNEEAPAGLPEELE